MILDKSPVGLGCCFYTARVSVPFSQGCEDEIGCSAQFLARGTLCELTVSQVVQAEIAFRVHEDMLIK